MSGKRTDLDPRDRRHVEAAWDAPLAHALDWASVEDALDRTLTAEERERVSDLVGTYATFIAQTRAARVTTQDVKRTLGALARMEPEAARKAYARADGWTQAQIAGAMVRAGARDGDALAQPSGEQIVDAAKAAIVGIKGAAGRHPDDAQFPRSILVLWRALGGHESAPAAKDDYATPLVRFAAALFYAAGAPPCDLPAIAARIRAI